MSQAKAARKTLDLAKLAVALKLRTETTQALGTFRKRHEELLRIVGELQQARQSIDFNSYRSVLKNKKVVDEAESLFNSFKPSVFPLDEHFKVIQAYQTISLEKAAETERNLQAQLKDLKETLINIKEARPVEELTIDDIVKADPSIEDRVMKRCMNYQWTSEKFDKNFGSFAVA